MDRNQGMIRPIRLETGREIMRTPDEVMVILELKRKGWGAKRIGCELGISKNTVKRYIRCGGWEPYGRPSRRKALDEQRQWIAEQYDMHHGNADVVRQELQKQFGLQVSLRTVERAVAPQRREMRARSQATERFETAPGKQMQADFGQTRVLIGGERIWVFLCVFTLGYSRRPFVKPFAHERQLHWFEGIEAAGRHFGGFTEELLIDNARALVKLNNPQTGEVIFTDAFRAFAAYWGFRPRACAPFRARTKGKDENGVGYVKRNAIAGHSFESWEALEGHLAWWMREVADVRIHGTTGEQPLQRFLRDEAKTLRPLEAKAPFVQARELVRCVHTDLCVELETNHYSVPWRYIGEQVILRAEKGQLRVLYAGQEIARHLLCRGRRQRIVDPRHFDGVALRRLNAETEGGDSRVQHKPAHELLRPLSDYEAVVGAQS
jgi:transposase